MPKNPTAKATAVPPTPESFQTRDHASLFKPVEEVLPLLLGKRGRDALSEFELDYLATLIKELQVPLNGIAAIIIMEIEGKVIVTMLDYNDRSNYELDITGYSPSKLIQNDIMKIPGDNLTAAEFIVRTTGRYISVIRVNEQKDKETNRPRPDLPRWAEQNRKTQTVRFRVEPDLVKALMEAASANNQTVSDWLRDAVKEHLTQSPKLEP